MKKQTFEFAIKKHILNSGKEVYTPVVRRKRWLMQEPWNRITCIYGTYTLLDLDFEPNLTYEQCNEHIVNYQNHLAKLNENDVKVTELHELEEQTY